MNIWTTEMIPPAPRLAVDVAGAGPLAVFLHGIGGNRRNWHGQLAAFAGEYRAAAWDARGYGGSDDYQGELDFADFSDDLARLLDHFGAERAHLVGLSMGGRIAQHFYFSRPDRVATLTLADTHPGFSHLSPAQREDYIRARREPLEAGKEPRDIAPGLVARLAGPHASEEMRAHLTESIAMLRKEPYLKSLAATVRQDTIGKLEDISVPTHFIVGEHDTLTTPAIMRDMAAQVPGAEFTLIAGAGHLSNLEFPDEFDRAALAFLARHRERADSVY
jgi:3-oxoadipate enol-lactonase